MPEDPPPQDPPLIGSLYIEPPREDPIRFGIRLGKELREKREQED